MLVPVALALTAALLLAVAAVLQQDAASRAPRHTGFGAGTRLFASLLARPRWLAGQLTGGAGLALLAVALHLGQVVVVQPLIATQLVFSLLISGLLARRRTGRSGLDAGLWGAAALVVGGLVVFLLTARPHLDGSPLSGLDGEPSAHDDTWLLTAAGTALVAQACAALASSRLAPRWRSLLFALTAALGFGAGALLLAATGDRLAQGTLVSLPLVALAVVVPSSVVTAQRAFQAGAVTTALPTIAAVEPVVAVSLAGPVLGEHLAAGPGWRAGQLVGLAALVTGVVVLARRQAHAAEVAPAPQSESSRSSSSGANSSATSSTTRGSSGERSGSPR